MQVTADIRRSDLVNLNLYVYPRHRNTYIIFALFVVIGLAIPLVHDGKFSSQGLLLGLAIGVAMGLIMVVFTFLICVLGQALSSPKNTGRLGQRTYNLQDDGFEWASETGNGKQKWTAISTVTKTRNYVLIAITPSLFFIVPSRAFPSGEAFNAFFDQALSLWKRSNP
jgi:hypothetical protein